MGDQPKDSEIVALLNKSDVQGLKKIFDKYHQQLFNYLIYRTGNTGDAEDLLQNVYLRLWKYRNNITNENLSAYLYSIATSLSNNLAKKRKTELEFIRKNLHRSDTDLEVEETWKSEDLEKLKQCIHQLPEKQRSTLLMNRMEGLTYKEIARYLDLSQKAIEKRISKSYELLRACLKEIL